MSDHFLRKRLWGITIHRQQMSEDSNRTVLHLDQSRNMLEVLDICLESTLIFTLTLSFRNSSHTL